MSRTQKIVLAAVVATVLTVAGIVVANNARTVEVTTGEQVVCTYGHVVSEDVETIRVPARDAAEYGVRTVSVVCPDHKKAESLYEQAQTALAKADLKAAEDKLRQVIALDPTYRQAQSQLDQIAEGKKPQPDGSSAEAPSGNDTGTKPSTPGDTDKPSGPVASLTSWMPDDIAGYKADKIVADVLAVSRRYLPDSAGRVESLVIAAEELGSAQNVKAAYDRDYRYRYDKDAKTVTVNGRKGYLSSDGRAVAVLAITDGSKLVVLQLSTDTGDPRDLLGDLTKIAQELPR